MLVLVRRVLDIGESEGVVRLVDGCCSRLECY